MDVKVVDEEHDRFLILTLYPKLLEIEDKLFSIYRFGINLVKLDTSVF